MGIVVKVGKIRECWGAKPAMPSISFLAPAIPKKDGNQLKRVLIVRTLGNNISHHTGARVYDCLTIPSNDLTNLKALIFLLKIILLRVNVSISHAGIIIRMLLQRLYAAAAQESGL
jgi:hypothetical protein